jgi:hypothetical protein
MNPNYISFIIQIIRFKLKTEYIIDDDQIKRMIKILFIAILTYFKIGTFFYKK